MNNISVLKDIVLFISINALFFLAHYGLSTFNILEPSLLISVPESFLINAILSFLVCLATYFSHQVFKGQTGFIYLGFSLVKMFLLYAILYPKSGIETISMSDKLALLIPFGLNLILEQVFVVKLLKLMDLSKS